jgi:glycosyltransferase involved in cell wall biosynthesis
MDNLVENKLNVWILQTGEPLHIDEDNPRPMRAMNLANKLIKAGHSVTIWSSVFYHQKKRHRKKQKRLFQLSPYLKIHLINSIGYKKNVGVARLIDHMQLAINLKILLNKEKPPNVAFVGYPPIETASVMISWLKKNKIPTILDVKDLWPNIFISGLHSCFKPVGRILLYPYFYIAKKTMKDCTAITSMAENFLDWAIEFSKRDRNIYDGVHPLTAPLHQLKKSDLNTARFTWDKKGIINDGRIRFIFIGTLSRAFDFTPLRDLALLAKNNNDTSQFIICGQGDKLNELKQLMKGLENVIFPGLINKNEIVALAERSTVAIAPYVNREDFMKSIPNKVIDALSLGLPIISPLKGHVYELINDYKVGLTYAPGTGRTFIDCYNEIINKPSIVINLSRNAKRTYKEHFSYDKVYGSLVTKLEMLVAD